MKKIMMSFMILLSVMTLAGCAKETTPEAETAAKLKVVTTIFPQYDWTRQVLGDEADHVELTLLVDNGLDLHNYQPSAQDIVTIAECDVFIYVGGESDAWVDEVLANVANDDMVILNLLDAVGESVKEEEIKAGMDERYLLDEADSDEHVWLSLRNARSLCQYIVDELSLIDEGNADYYQENAQAYVEKLAALDEEYTKGIEAGTVNTLLFGDRFPFRYLIDDYGLDYYAAFPGCSAETEASFDTIVFLANKMDELQLQNVMVTESSDQAVAETIIKNTTAKNQQILTLDSMQSVGASDIADGATYLNIMQRNLSVIKEAVK